MLLAVGGESRRIVLGEVPPVQPEQEQEPAQDVAAQWRHQEGQGSHPVPKPRQRVGKSTESKTRNRKSNRRRFRASGNHPHWHIIVIICSHSTIVFGFKIHVLLIYFSSLKIVMNQFGVNSFNLIMTHLS